MAYYLFEDKVKKENTFPYTVTRYCYEPKKTRDIVCIEHNHSQLELLYALRGKFVCYVDGQPHELTAGDTIIIDPFRQHVCEWSDDCDSEYICLTYTLNLLKKFSEVTLVRAIDDIDGGNLSFDLIIKGGSPDGEIVGELIRKIDGTYKAETASDILYGLSSAYQLLARLTERHVHEKVESETVRRDKAFMRDIQGYVFDHFREDIHTSDAAKALFMNKTQFCTQFTKYFGCNFSHYLCRCAKFFANDAI